MHSRPVRTDPLAAAVYLRRLPGMDEAAVHRVLTELVAFAALRELAVACVQFEQRPGARLGIWAELISCCRSEGIVNVLVPSAEHFHHDRVIAEFMREELAAKIEGCVSYVSKPVTVRAVGPAAAEGRREQ